MEAGRAAQHGGTRPPDRVSGPQSRPFATGRWAGQPAGPYEHLPAYALAPGAVEDESLDLQPGVTLVGHGPCPADPIDLDGQRADAVAVVGLRKLADRQIRLVRLEASLADHR